MIIGGIEPFSLSDFPGVLAAVLFTQGCNFLCPYCHNKDLIPFENNADSDFTREAILSYLRQRKNQLEGVVFGGGEPCVHEDLVDWMTEIRNLGFLIKLDTNGSFPDRLEALIRRRLLAYIAMDIKTPLGDYDKVSGTPRIADRVSRSMDIISASNIPHQFRTTWDKNLLTDLDLDTIRSQIPNASPHVIQECRQAGHLLF